MLRKLLILSFLMVAVIVGSAQVYVPVQEGSAVKFVIRNFGMNVHGEFKNIKGAIKFNNKDLSAGDFKVTVDAFTINTGNGSRDKHLKQSEYFDVANYPELIFTSTGISQTNTPTRFLMNGNISIKGKEKHLSFPFTAIPIANGYLFEGSFKLNRREFGVGGNSLVLSDNVVVSVTIAAKNK